MENKKEFNLSEHEIIGWDYGIDLDGVYSGLDVKKFIKKLKEEVDEYRKKRFQIHNVDECDCCEKNLNNIFKILEKIDKLAGDKLI